MQIYMESYSVFNQSQFISIRNCTKMCYYIDFVKLSFRRISQF